MSKKCSNLSDHLTSQNGVRQGAIVDFKKLYLLATFEDTQDTYH